MLNVLKILLVLLCCSSSVFAKGKTYWFNDPKLQKKLDEETRSKAYSGNQITLYPTGALSFQQRRDNIASADVILLKTFELWDDETGRGTIDQLIARAKEGAIVVIQFDVRGLYYTFQELNAIIHSKKELIPPFIRRFLDESMGNGYVVPTSFPPGVLKNYPFFNLPNEHEKYLITWEYKKELSPVKVILGGMNIGDMYAFSGQRDAKGNFRKVPYYYSEGYAGSDTYPLRDSDIEVIGRVTQDIVAEYIRAAQNALQNPNKNFQEKFGSGIKKAIDEMKDIQSQMLEKQERAFPKKIGNAFARFIADPSDREKDELNIQNCITLMLENVPKGSDVKFVTSQFLPSIKVEQALLEAAGRDVKIDVLSNKPGGPENGIDKVAMASRCRYRKILKEARDGSINFYDWEGNPQEGLGKIHRKIFMFGEDIDAPFTFGSSNLDMQSLRWNSEDILLIQCPELKDEVDALLEKDFSKPNSTPITLPELENEPRLQKLQECGLERIFHQIL